MSIVAWSSSTRASSSSTASFARWVRGHGQPAAGLVVRQGHAAEEIARLAAELHVQAVYANHDDEPAALARDARVRGLLAAAGVACTPPRTTSSSSAAKCSPASALPYSVFTPYKNAWLKKLEPFFLQAYPVEKHAAALADIPSALQRPVPTLGDIGFEPSNLHA